MGHPKQPELFLSQSAPSAPRRLRYCDRILATLAFLARTWFWMRGCLAPAGAGGVGWTAYEAYNPIDGSAL